MTTQQDGSHTAISRDDLNKYIVAFAVLIYIRLEINPGWISGVNYHENLHPSLST